MRLACTVAVTGSGGVTMAGGAPPTPEPPRAKPWLRCGVVAEGRQVGFSAASGLRPNCVPQDDETATRPRPGAKTSWQYAQIVDLPCLASGLRGNLQAQFGSRLISTKKKAMYRGRTVGVGRSKNVGEGEGT